MVDYISPRKMSDSDATWMTPMGNNDMGKGAVLFTGPDGIGDYKVGVVTDDRFVGIGTMSAEGTSELKYITRASPQTPHPRPKTRWVGEIGWLIPPFKDFRAVSTRHQIKNGEFRRANENRHTHLYQNPWYPGPNDVEYSSMYRFTGRNFIPAEEKSQRWKFPAASTGLISSAYTAARSVSIPLPREQPKSASYCSRNHDGQLPSMYNSPHRYRKNADSRRRSQTSFSDRGSDLNSQSESYTRYNQHSLSNQSFNNNNASQRNGYKKVSRLPTATSITIQS
ncbi:uncharacterized protein C4orf45 homolog [Anneissia japonica]|uniref:uncharacterized protein C4orf45 homolog n=1 Tax=Anneissia japonica TaxID=1529436 RepID=UPI0014256EBD|nr:uncharacterized protein C4orf45 homolog [Anneissia japonica]